MTLRVGAYAMSDFLFAMLVLLALAAVGNFAGDPAMSVGCAGDDYIKICN